jgi:hypothetical protein
VRPAGARRLARHGPDSRPTVERRTRSAQSCARRLARSPQDRTTYRADMHVWRGAGGLPFPRHGLLPPYGQRHADGESPRAVRQPRAGPPGASTSAPAVSTRDRIRAAGARQSVHPRVAADARVAPAGRVGASWEGIHLARSPRRETWPHDRPHSEPVDRALGRLRKAQPAKVHTLSPLWHTTCLSRRETTHDLARWRSALRPRTTCDNQLEPDRPAPRKRTALSGSDGHVPRRPAQRLY